MRENGDYVKDIAGLIEHTLLRPEATTAHIEKICREAVEYGFYAVCINPYYVPLAVSILQKTRVKVCTVVGFPLGATTTCVKVTEAREAVAAGAQEIDMVINIGALKSGDFKTVQKDIEAVVKAAEPALTKVIIETALLDEEEKKEACLLALRAGAHFVKTSTGFGPGGATVEDVVLMRKVVGSAMGIKAAGGIRELNTARAMVAAGANRIGTSNGVAIVSKKGG
ncbi:deoxyribose-phosphate aldolase [Calderihabitans maritimus]|uniref:deoxyribose-phosphate aldolase n=1 Tax=Calderihabitans maritimus TaxID=1246530 RepID=UPI001EDFE6C4|nr:deoxyribose-phosphate aldolase [Calderihabitans maritimus]